MANIGQLPHNDARTKMVSSMKELEELDQKLVSHALAKGQERAKARGYTGENAQDFAREFAKGFCQAVEDSASKERERVQSVLAQSMPGHEALVNELAFDGKTTGPEAAAAVLQAKKRKHFVVVSRTNELKQGLRLCDYDLKAAWLCNFPSELAANLVSNKFTQPEAAVMVVS